MNWRERRQRRMGFWRRLPPLAYGLFLAGVFCLFASFGLISQIGQGLSWTSALGTGIYTGILSTGFAWLGTREEYLWMIPWALVTMVGWPTLQNDLWPQAATVGTPGFAAIAAMAFVMAGYVLFLTFVSTEGRRQFRLEAEMNLAGEIHRGLAPAIAQQIGRYEFAGSSHASGQVGGDLLDVVAVEGGWLAYIADVAGHGVAAGVLMGLVKSAVHAWLAARGGSEEGILPGLNRVLWELLPAESYVTLAAITLTANGDLLYVAAGHPPILHFHAATNEVSEHGVDNFPLGMFAEASFQTERLACAAGDILAIYTDGLVEIFDRKDQEFGLEGMRAALREAAAMPLQHGAGMMVERAREFGAQTDDQTLLLVRCGSPVATAEPVMARSGQSASAPETVE